MNTLGVHGFDDMAMHGSISQWENRISTLLTLSFCFQQLAAAFFTLPQEIKIVDDFY